MWSAGWQALYRGIALNIPLHTYLNRRKFKLFTKKNRCWRTETQSWSTIIAGWDLQSSKYRAIDRRSIQRFVKQNLFRKSDELSAIGACFVLSSRKCQLFDMRIMPQRCYLYEHRFPDSYLISLSLV